VKAWINLNGRGESVLSIGNALGGRGKNIAREAREMNKKPLGCMVADLCAKVTNSNKK